MAQCASPPAIFTTRAPSGMSSSAGRMRPRRWGGTRSRSAEMAASAATSARFVRKASVGTDAVAELFVAVARLVFPGSVVAVRVALTFGSLESLGGTTETPGTPSGSPAPGPKTADKIPPTLLRVVVASSSSSSSSSTVRGFRLRSSPYRNRLCFSVSVISVSASSRSDSNASGSPYRCTACLRRNLGLRTRSYTRCFITSSSVGRSGSTHHADLVARSSLSAPAANARFAASSGCSCATSSARSRSSSRAFCSASARMARASRSARLCACRTASAAVSGSIASSRRASCDAPRDAGSKSAPSASSRAVLDGASSSLRGTARGIDSSTFATSDAWWSSSSPTSPPSPPRPLSSPRRPSGDAGRRSAAIRARTGHLLVVRRFSALPLAKTRASVACTKSSSQLRGKKKRFVSPVPFSLLFFLSGLTTW